jgi:hypothetical protein
LLTLDLNVNALSIQLFFFQVFFIQISIALLFLVNRYLFCAKQVIVFVLIIRNQTLVTQVLAIQVVAGCTSTLPKRATTSMNTNVKHDVLNVNYDTDRELKRTNGDHLRRHQCLIMPNTKHMLLSNN